MQFEEPARHEVDGKDDDFLADEFLITKPNASDAQLAQLFVKLP